MHKLPEIYTAEEMCEIYRCSRPSLRKRCKEGDIPEPKKLGRKLFWPRWTIEEHLGKKPVEQAAPSPSIDEIRDSVRRELAAELTPMLTALTRTLCKGVPDHAHT